MKRAIVTGSNGFIGSHLVERLKKEGFEVYRLTYHMLDSHSKLKAIIEKINPEYIYHLAGYGNMSNQENDDEVIMSNIVRTWTLLKATKDINYKLFVNFSTSSVYGFYDKPMGEWLKIRPRTMYAATKAGAEYICRAFRKKYLKCIVTVRPFSVYGPGEADFRFIPTIIRNAIENKPSSVIGGNHDFIYIDDFIDGVIKITEEKANLTKRTFNIGSGKMYSNEQVVEEISKYLDVRYEFTNEFKKTDSKVWVASIQRMRMLNYEPKTTLEEGIKKTVEYYIKRYGR